MANVSKFMSAIGLFATGLAAAKVLSLIGIYLLPSRISHYAHTSSSGQSPWALVTGASDGIGRAFAQELAAQGFNVVLHGRNNAKLSLVQSQLQERFPERSFRILVADASAVPCVNCLTHGQPQEDKDSSKRPLDFAAIKTAVDDLHLTVLVNNAGGPAPDIAFLPLAECSEAGSTGTVSVNALFPFHLTRALLPSLARNGPALVINISSVSDKGFPWLVSYSASKAFLMSLTRAVGLETAMNEEGSKVEVLGIRVGRVTGVSFNKTRSSLFVPSSDTMARAALDRAGYGHEVVVGYWAHALQQLGVNLLPEWLGNKIVTNVLRQERERELASGRKIN